MSSKYLFGDKDDEQVEPLYKVFPEVNENAKHFDETKYIAFIDKK